MTTPRGTASKKKKPARQAMPGGAPVPKKSKKKKTASKRTTAVAAVPAAKPKKAKPPCKYGPRGADGYCPKKPKSARSTRTNPTRVTAKTPDAAAEQAIKVLTNPKASAEQKTAAITQVGTTIVTDAARSTVRKNRTKIIDAVKKHGSTVAGVVLPVAAGIQAAKAIPRQREKEARKFADAELAKTRKRAGAQWNESLAPTLWQQYFDFAVRRPVTNTFLGK